MKIVIINGSPRVNGSTASILNIIKFYLQNKRDVEIKFYNISELNFNFCKGCCYCFENGMCFINDDAEKLSNDICDADGIIIGSPTYESNISGQLKTFIDRGHFIIEQLLYNKYAVGIITSENYGALSSGKILKNIFSYSGASITEMINFKIPFSDTYKLTNKSIRKLEKTAEILYRDIKKKKIYTFQKIKHNIIFNFGIKPFVVNKGEKYKGVLKNWQKNRVDKLYK